MSYSDPYLFLLDIDGTLVGDITYHVVEWEILTRFDKKKLRVFKQQLIDSLKSGLLRSSLSDFLTQLKTHNESTEFYLYTAGETKWVHFLIPCIEQACGFKFNRPYFTRNHCQFTTNSVKKSLAKISPIIYSKLKTKYNFKSSNAVLDNLILVDNTRVLGDKELKRWIACPTYEYKALYDVLRNLDSNVFHEHSLAIATIMQKYGIMRSLSSSAVEKSYSGYLIAASYYEDYARDLRAYAKSNRSTKDKFWISLANAIIILHKKKVSKDSMVKYINSKLLK